MMQMEGLEKIFKDSEIVGKCPEMGIEANLEYVGKVTIRHPKKRIQYNFQCSICNNRHYLHEIENLRLKRKGKC